MVSAVVVVIASSSWGEDRRPRDVPSRFWILDSEKIEMAEGGNINKNASSSVVDWSVIPNCKFEEELQGLEYEDNLKVRLHSGVTVARAISQPYWFRLEKIPTTIHTECTCT